MPQRVSVRKLFDICVDYAAVNIDDILKCEEQTDRKGPTEMMKFQNLPDSLFHLLSDKILSVGSLHDDNVHLILSRRTRNITKWNSFGIKKPVQFLELIREHCKSIEKIDLRPLLDNQHWAISIPTKSCLVGRTLASMVNLEWISLMCCGINDECLKYIGSKCENLKYLDVSCCRAVTDYGIRALCDPSLAPYGKCSQLTQLNISGMHSETPSPEVVCLLLLNCNNLEYLYYTLTSRGLAAAIAAIDSSVAPDLWKSDEDRITLPSEILTTSSFATKPYGERVFKLKNIQYHCGTENFDEIGEVTSARPFFEALSKYCPSMEDLFLCTSTMNLGDLHGLFSLPLRSVHLSGECFHGAQDSLLRELRLLVQSVGNALTNLNLSGFSVFDLRVIRLECPNLKSLELANCDMVKSSLRRSIYSVDELNTASAEFKLLTNLSICGKTLIPTESFVSLLSSPNLEVVLLQDFDAESNLLRVVQQVLNRCPVGFSKLQSIKFIGVELDRATVATLLDKAVFLSHLDIMFCVCRRNREVVSFDERVYFNQVIKANSWALQCNWYGCYSVEE